MDNGADSYRRFLDGDDNAIGEIIRQYKDGLILFLNSFCSNLNIAEEIAEETFVKIAIKKPGYTGKSSFKTWLYSIGRHTAADYLRKHFRFRLLSLFDCSDTLDNTDIETELIKSERNIFLHKIMNSLKAEHRQVLYLSFFEDMSNGDIAKIMNKDRRQIENLIYNAKRSLRSKLEKEGFSYDEL